MNALNQSEFTVEHRLKAIGFRPRTSQGLVRACNLDRIDRALSAIDGAVGKCGYKRQKLVQEADGGTMHYWKDSQRNLMMVKASKGRLSCHIIPADG